MVLFFHVASKEKDLIPLVPDVKMYLTPLIYFGYGGVQIFFVISGFIMVFISQGEFGRSMAWRDFLVRRFVRIYPIYWVVLLATAILFMSWFHVTQCNDPVALSAAALLAVPKNCFVAQAWTLHYEVVFYLVFAGLIVLRSKMAIVVGTAIATAGILYRWNTVSQYLPHFEYIDDVERYLSVFLFFWPGCVVALLIGAGCRRFAWPAITLGTLVIAASGIANQLGMMDTEDFIDRLIEFSSVGSLLVYGAVSLDMRGRFKMPRAILLIGDASYVIYLTHLTVFPIFWKIFASHLHHHYSLHSHFEWLASMAVGSTVIGIAVHLLVEKPLLRFGHSMVRSRKLTAVEASAA
jgi:peptidoglycan/LPS O-acetylase OafA/YrhL